MKRYLTWWLKTVANALCGGRRGEIWLVIIRIRWRKWRGLPVMMGFWSQGTPMMRANDDFEIAFGEALARRLASETKEYGIRSHVPVDTFAEPKP